MRIDIKSESELDAEGADPSDSSGAARAALQGLPDVSPELADSLVTAGMSSPEAIVQAGLERLCEVPDIGARGESIYAAAAEWVAARRSTSETPGGSGAQEDTPSP